MKARICISAAVLFGLAALTDCACHAADQDAPTRRVKRLDIDVRVSADGSSAQVARMEILATTTATAMQVAQARVAYDPATQTLDITDAYTLKKDGRMIAVDPAAIYDQLEPGAPQLPLFSGLHVKTLVFPQFEAGDTAAYTQRITTHPYFPGAYWYVDSYPKLAPFDEVRETITAPASMHLETDSYGVEVERREKNGEIVLSWSYSAPEPEKPKVLAVSPLATTPHVFVSSFRSYAALGAAYAKAAAPKTAVTPEIRKLADDLTIGISDKREIAQKLYEWVLAHIRYVAIELGKGSLIPHDAASVLTNGYGDCKDHVTLLAALLEAKGIRSEAALINSGVTYTLTTAPTFVGLDHVITFLPDFDLYLDSTSFGTPFGVLPFPEYGKPVVHATLDGGGRGNTPSLQPDVATMSMKTDATLDSDGTLSGTTVTTANGPYSILLRAIGLLVQTAGPQASAARLLGSLGYGDAATGALEAPPPTDPGPAYTITGRFAGAAWKSQLQGDTRFPIPGGLRLLGPLGDGAMGDFGADRLDAAAERPCYSVSTVEELTLHVPRDATFDHVPHDAHIKTDYLTFDAQWSVHDGAMSVRRTFTSRIRQALCSPEIRAANEKALKAIADDYDTELWFRKVTGYKPELPAVDRPRIELQNDSAESSN